MRKLLGKVRLLMNYQGHQLMKQTNMVVGLPSIQNNDNICEGCIYGKIHRLPFLVDGC